MRRERELSLSNWKVYLTGVGGGDDGGVGKVTVEVVAAGGLVVGVHGEGGMSPEAVGEEARPSFLDRLAVHDPAAARVVYVRLKRRVARVGLGHAPLPARRRRRRTTTTTGLHAKKETNFRRNKVNQGDGEKYLHSIYMRHVSWNKAGRI